MPKRKEKLVSKDINYAFLQAWFKEYGEQIDTSLDTELLLGVRFAEITSKQHKEKEKIL